TVSPEKLAADRPREMPWFIPMSLAAALVALIGSVALLPGLWTPGDKAKTAVPRGNTAEFFDFDRDGAQQLQVPGLLPSQKLDRSYFRNPLSEATGDAEKAAKQLKNITDDSFQSARQKDLTEISRRQREEEDLERSGSDGAPAQLRVGGIVLPSQGQLAKAPDTTTGAGLAPKQGPANASSYGGIGGGGGLGGGGSLVEGGGIGRDAPVSVPSL